MTRIRAISILLITAALVVGACSGAAGTQLKIQDPWVRAASAMGMENQTTQDQNTSEMSEGGEMGGQMSGANSAAYMVIQNPGSVADRLVKAESEVAESVEIHLSEMKDGVMSMHPVDGVDVPARGQAELKPGSFHIMLIRIKHDLKEGDKVNFKLFFENAGTMEVVAEVRMP